MKQEIAASGGHSTVIMDDNHSMTQTAVPFRRVLRAPATKRVWAEISHALASFPLAVAALAVAIPMLENGIFWAWSTPILRWFGGAARFLARELLGEDIGVPPGIRPTLTAYVRTPDPARLAAAAITAGGKTRVWETKPGVTIKKVPHSRITELAAAEGITITGIRTPHEALEWVGARTLDPVAWRARGYFAVKLPLAAAGLAVIAGCWLGGMFCLTFPVWAAGLGIGTVPGSFALLPIGALLLLFGPVLMHGITEADLWLMRALLGPSTPAERVRALERSRAQAVDSSAARLRAIERDLHDGTQAQLVALAMKLGLALEKLQHATPVDLVRATQLVDDAHRGTLEAIADLRTLARGIHPPVLGSGLADALATLANRSAVPIELVTDIPERPSDAIETIGYFSAAELLANVARHSGARHATLEAVHVPGLLRVRVTDDGAGGARLVPNGGLCGLSERVRTVDGRLEIDSPRGGPTTVTVELPSHA